LPFLDSVINKLIHFSAFHTEYVVVVAALVQFKNRVTTLEMMPIDQTGRFKLRK